MARRSIALVAAIAVVAMGPLPVSACALLSNLAAECQPEPECHSAPRQAADSELSAAEIQDCCVLSQAPALPATDKGTAPVAAFALVPARESEVLPAADLKGFSYTSLSIVCPPDFQTLFCVFLI